MWVIDFETDAIVGNPTVRPPKPVGVATKRPGYKSRYFAWGHPDGNNCTYEQARAHLLEIKAQRVPVLFHNAKFDLSVMREHMGIEFDPALVHDTMFLIFLTDPYADTFSLKPSSERILGWAPDEQDDVRRWVLNHVPCKPSEWGAHIAKAPVSLVAPYARGDVDRTLALYNHIYPKLDDTAAYDRERQLLPILIESEQHGVKLHMEKLGDDLILYEQCLAKVNARLWKLLKNPNVNLDSGEELADALDKAGLVSQWILTPTGRRSTSRDNLEAAIANPDMLALLRYRGALAHCLGSFMRPWVELGEEYNGRLHPEWNQVRQNRGKDSKGTRTGRLSGMKPSFMNVPNEYDLIIPEGCMELPFMRTYTVPDEGNVWLKRDYSQQELRVLAHYTEGALYERYLKNPRIDAHEETGALITELAGLELPRKYVKITGFSMIYGAGIPSLSQQLGVAIDEAASIKGAYLHALPEVKDLMDECKERGRKGLPITTWGGRDYFVEPPKIIAGRRRTFEYKLLNYLIQGSSADCTKTAIIEWAKDKGNGQFLATVHDEIDIQAPEESWQADMGKLQVAMENIPFDVKMLSDGFIGDSWQNLEKCE
jgi:DNA polymerase I-like protein with 3'-5' exonuclease and polymerase domains